jgi:hypothetical protein
MRGATGGAWLRADWNLPITIRSMRIPALGIGAIACSVYVCQYVWRICEIGDASGGAVPAASAATRGPVGATRTQTWTRRSRCVHMAARCVCRPGGS